MAFYPLHSSYSTAFGGGVRCAPSFLGIPHYVGPPFAELRNPFGIGIRAYLTPGAELKVGRQISEFKPKLVLQSALKYKFQGHDRYLPFLTPNT